MLFTVCCGGGTADREIGGAASAAAAASSAGNKGDGCPVGRAAGICFEAGGMNELLSVSGAKKYTFYSIVKRKLRYF